MSDPVTIENILPLVRKPGRYIGGELNSSRKRWDDAQVRFALVFPDLYEIGMSHQGLQILYHIINSKEGMLAERCYAPDIDMEQQLRNHNLPLFSLESRRALGSFDVLGITLPYELSYTNILTVLDLSGIPFRSLQRGDDSPLIIGGGSCGLNPEPVADFFDAIALGDGEEIILDIGEAVRDAKGKGYPRQDILLRLAELEGVYVPSLFVPQYDTSGFKTVTPLKSGYTSVRRRVLSGLSNPEDTFRPIVPVVKPVHDRLGVEIARGCTRGCRFCQAGIIYRPVRERPVEDVIAIAERGIQCSGFHEMALLSLSSGDYSCLPELMVRLMNRFADRYVSISMPSMRVGTLTPEIMDQIKRVRKTGFTVAPEAGSDRLRKVINKGITEEDLLETCRNVFAMGWNLIKFYFMVGLPTETWDDVDAIVELAGRARAAAGRAAKRTQINVSVGTFVPKPHTPFQWERQLNLEEAKERIDRLKKTLPRRGFKLKWHDPQQSFLEGVFSRGDRLLANLIEQAWHSGVRLDGWSEHYSLEKWQQAAEKCGIDLETYLQERDPEKPLPWDHLSSGVEREYLVQERENALAGVFTSDCRTDGCRKCGLCDFKNIMPVVNKPAETGGAVARKMEKEEKRVDTDQGDRFVYRVSYSRTGDARFYSHLETLQLIFRVLARAGVPVLYSHGFNPTPRVSFSSALPVGMESEAEYFDVELERSITDFDHFMEELNLEMPDGMQVFGVEFLQGKDAPEHLAFYSVNLPVPIENEHKTRISDFLAREHFVVTRVRKGKARDVDIRPLVKDIQAHAGRLDFELISREGLPGVNPRELLLRVVGLDETDVLLARVKKTKVVDFSSRT